MFKIGNHILGALPSSQWARTASLLTRSLQRLASGTSVLDPKDNSAIYSSILGLSSQVRGLRRSTLDLNNTKEAVTTAESGIEMQRDILNKMKELAQQGLNAGLDSGDREDLNSQLQSLYEEFEKIATQTNYGGQKLLSGNYGSQKVLLSDNSNDVATISFENTTQSKIFGTSYYTGNGNFNTSFTTVNSYNSSHIKSGDFDGDGDQEIIGFSGSAISRNFNIYELNDNGTIWAKTNQTISGLAFTSVAVADVNNDGRLDAIGGAANGQIAFLYGKGDGTFETASTIYIGSATSVTDLEFSDMNADGNLDLIYTAGSSVYTRVGNGDGTFQSAVTRSGSGTTDYLEIADFNSDGRLDASASWYDGVNYGYDIYWGNGSGGFSSLTSQTVAVDTSTFLPMAVADLTNDSISDIIYHDRLNDRLFIRVGNGDGTFATALYTATYPGSVASSIMVTDLDEDGKNDIVLGNGAGFVVHKGNGTGSPGAATLYGLSATPTSLVAIDITGDNVKDLLGGNSTIIRTVSQRATHDRRAATLSLMSEEEAAKALEVLDASITQLEQAQANMAAIHSRLDSTVAANLLWSENLEDARDLSTGADYVYEIAELTRLQIIQNSQVAAHSHNLLQAQIVEQLLNFN